LNGRAVFFDSIARRVLDTIWDTALELDSWIVGWGQARCGQAGVAAVSSAYQGLLNTVYLAGQQHELHHFYASSMEPLENGPHGSSPWTNSFALSDLYSAAQALGEASAMCAASPIRFDLVDTVREVLLTGPGACAYNCMMTAFGKKSASGVNASHARLQAVLADTNQLLATRKEFLLGDWLASAYALGQALNATDVLLWNARSQVTLW
jgi:alpha-N-acetylglucosaminidase